MRNDPKATYSFEEAVSAIINCEDSETLDLLSSVLEDEKHYYCLVDLQSIDWIIKRKRERPMKRFGELG